MWLTCCTAAPCLGNGSTRKGSEIRTEWHRLEYQHLRLEEPGWEHEMESAPQHAAWARKQQMWASGGGGGGGEGSGSTAATAGTTVSCIPAPTCCTHSIEVAVRPAAAASAPEAHGFRCSGRRKRWRVSQTLGRV